MRKNIIILMFCFTLGMSAQTDKTPNWKIEILYTTDIINSSYGINYGFIFKGKRVLLEKKKIRIMAGLAYQNSYINEKENLFTNYVTGYTRDLGLSVLADIIWYPFHKKKVFLSIEPFLGLTNLKSKGVLKIPHLNIEEKYHNSYSYLNYGVIHSIGYHLNKITINAAAWVSLKGFADEGRFRPGDFDSRLFLGIGIGYAFN